MSSDNPDYSMTDYKDWTWVNERPCPECGFAGESVARGDIASIIRSQIGRYQAAASNNAVAARPAPDIWSAHEYICHVRDVYALYAVRLDLMLNEDNPLYANWDQDETAAADQYVSQSLEQALVDLETHANVLADMYAAITDDQWPRLGRRSDGVEFTIESLGTYLVHDPEHHLHDIAEGYSTLSG